MVRTFCARSAEENPRALCTMSMKPDFHFGADHLNACILLRVAGIRRQAFERRWHEAASPTHTTQEPGPASVARQADECHVPRSPSGTQTWTEELIFPAQTFSFLKL